MTYTLAMMKRDSDRALMAYRRSKYARLNLFIALYLPTLTAATV